MVLVEFDSKGRVDFDAPVYFTDDQREKFLAYMRTLAPSQAEVRNVAEPEKTYKRDAQGNLGRWKPEELVLVVSGHTKEEIMAKTGRTDMAVQAHLGWFPQEFFHWARSQGLGEKTLIEQVRAFVESWKK
jgi:hypothetical protein